jgi:hypothetical protein
MLLGVIVLDRHVLAFNEALLRQTSLKRRFDPSIAGKAAEEAD